MQKAFKTFMAILYSLITNHFSYSVSIFAPSCRLQPQCFNSILHHNISFMNIKIQRMSYLCKHKRNRHFCSRHEHCVKYINLPSSGLLCIIAQEKSTITIGMFFFSSDGCCIFEFKTVPHSSFGFFRCLASSHNIPGSSCKCHFFHTFLCKIQKHYPFRLR